MIQSLNMVAEDLVEFVVKNRVGKKAFFKYTERQIKLQILDGLIQGTCFYSKDVEGKIDGVVTATLRDEGKVMYVLNILANHKNCIKNFFVMFKNRFPNFRLTALRRGKPVEYNVERLQKKLLK